MFSVFFCDTMFIDIHTHDRPADIGAISVVNRDVGEWDMIEGENPDIYYSVGIHPWHIASDWKSRIPVLEKTAVHSRVLTIGESGLDKVSGKCDMELQKDVFRRHVLLSEQARKPLLIHCVKAFSELLGIRKEMKPQQLWIVHGFRGKKELAQQLMNQGIELSFGTRFNTDALCEAYSRGKMWVETDDKSTLHISDVYGIISSRLGCSADELSLMQREKFFRIFGR